MSEVRPGRSQGIVKLLLTSGGVTNASIHAALVELLGKPIDRVRRARASRPRSGVTRCAGRARSRGFVAGDARVAGRCPAWAGRRSASSSSPPCPPSARSGGCPWVREADVLLVDGGDATYLCHWMRESGLADLLPSLPDTVWVGVSAGSMVMTPRIGASFVEWPPRRTTARSASSTSRSSRTWTLFPTNTLAHARAVGRRHRRPGVRHRRADGHRGGRRRRRGGLRRAVDRVRLCGATDDRLNRERTAGSDGTAVPFRRIGDGIISRAAWAELGHRRRACSRPYECRYRAPSGRDRHLRRARRAGIGRCQETQADRLITLRDRFGRRPSGRSTGAESGAEACCLRRR